MYTTSNKKNITSVLINSQISGRTPKSIKNYPPALFARLDQKWKTLPSIVVQLDSAISARDVNKCKTLLNAIGKRVCEVTSIEHQEQRELLLLLNGQQVILRLLLDPPQAAPSNSKKEVCEIGKLQAQCLSILRELCGSSVPFIMQLAASTETIVFLFSLLRKQETFESAVALIEEVFTAHTTTFCLSAIPNFNELVSGFSKGQLGIFCKVLAMIIFEPEERLENDEPVSSLELLSQRNRDRRPTVTAKNIDRNHAIILGVPQLVEKFVTLLKVTNSPNCRWTDQLIAHFHLAIDFLQNRYYQPDDFDWTNVDGISPSQRPQEENELMALIEDNAQGLKALALSTYQVELLFVLYALLTGKRKADLQARLAAADLIPTLTVLFDSIDWKQGPLHLQPHERVHGPECECNPDSALKVQLLRLILYFCDGDFENQGIKRLLLSELEIQRINAGVYAPVPEAHSRGLLSRLIVVFIELPSDMSYKFWISSCIEAFLRGSDPSFQLFVANSGLLRFLLDDILKATESGAGGLQTSFDLLGELMKFNRETFRMFNEALHPNNEARFFDRVMSHLVDSNVFLRSMMLSLERFSSDPGSYSTKHCIVARFIAEHKMRLLRDLMSIITIEDINMENICCVNTTLIWFVFARRQKELDQLLQALKEDEKTSGKVGRYTENFAKLLWFWNEYYHQKGRDCLSLEFSSQIQFKEWLATYTVLKERLLDNIKA